MRTERTEALREQVARWRVGPRGAAVDLAPGSAYEVVTRQMVEALRSDLEEIKGRLNGLLFMMAGAIVVDAVIRVTA